MPEQRYHLHPEAAEQAVDDCWNRIGIRGDKSCPRLAEHIHCRNCPVHAAAAVRLLDRYALGAEGEQAASVEDEAPPGDAYLLFRLGEEWLALLTRAGFGNVACLPGPDSPLARFGQHVFAAQKGR